MFDRGKLFLLLMVSCSVLDTIYVDRLAEVDLGATGGGGGPLFQI